jgi:hypothetical protein
LFWNAFFQIRPELGLLWVGASGKLATPWVRMQLVNLTASLWKCWIWAWLGPELELALVVPGELEPQAAIAVAASAAAITGRVERSLSMNWVVLRQWSHHCNRPL